MKERSARAGGGGLYWEGLPGENKEGGGGCGVRERR